MPVRKASIDDKSSQAKARGGKRPKRPMSEKEAKRAKKNVVAAPRKERDKDTIRQSLVSELERVLMALSRCGGAQLQGRIL